MLEIERSKRPASVIQIKQELYSLATTWADIVKGYFRPRVPARGISGAVSSDEITGR
jgi:hypothetical protein